MIFPVLEFTVFKARKTSLHSKHIKTIIVRNHSGVFEKTSNNDGKNIKFVRNI